MWSWPQQSNAISSPVSFSLPVKDLRIPQPLKPSLLLWQCKDWALRMLVTVLFMEGRMGNNLNVWGLVEWFMVKPQIEDHKPFPLLLGKNTQGCTKMLTIRYGKRTGNKMWDPNFISPKPDLYVGGNIDIHWCGCVWTFLTTNSLVYIFPVFFLRYVYLLLFASLYP